MPIYRFHNNSPTYDIDTFIAPNAILIGKVQLAKGANIWFGAVLRGDNESIIIGENSNIQENSILHTDMGCPLTIGDHVTVGHGVILHGCSIGNNSLIGMGATILNRAVIGNNCIVGAGALVTESKNFPDGSLIVGAPAKIARMLTPEEINKLPLGAIAYADRGRDYKDNLIETTTVAVAPR